MKKTALMFVCMLAAAGLALSGCGGGGGGLLAGAQPPGVTGDNVAVLQGNVIGDAAAPLVADAATNAAQQSPVISAIKAALGIGTAIVPLSGPTAVVAVDETGAIATSQVVTAANGQFSLTLPTDHSYMILFRQGTDTGPTLSYLVENRTTGRNTFSLPKDTPDKNLGDIVIDSQMGKALCDVDPDLAETAVAFPLDQIEWRAAVEIPTGAPPSPLTIDGKTATEFSQQMILFEEFGTEPLPAAEPASWTALPQPQNPQSGPQGAALDAFLGQAGISPFPTRLSNVNVANPWNPAIEAFLGRALALPTDGSIPGVPGPAEGRPSGEFYAHQYWDKLYPQKYFKTSVSPARVNGGLRDARQMHGYALGEFAPGGLYHNVAGVPATAGTSAGIGIAFHPNLPLQHPNSIWTFDGTLPPKLLMIRYGVPTLMRNYNTLPMDVTANNGIGRHTISTHDHNGHSPAESDGSPADFFFPGQYFDYRWPMQLAGFSNNNNAAGAINYDASDVRASTPCEPGESFPVLVNGEIVVRSCESGRIQIPGDWRETMSSHWFHDHMLDYTSQNVYKGNATMMNYYSGLDRGNEAVSDGVNLRLPSGSALPWGNRDYDVNLVVADKAWKADGQLWFDTQNHETGFLADRMTVNFLYKPYFDVRARRYRFRILNGSVSRIMAIGLVHQVAGNAGELPGPANSGVSYNRVPFHMIANDGNIMEHAVPFDGVMDIFHDGRPDAWKGLLPSQTIAERYDIVVDFSKHGIQPGDKLYFVNVMEHQNGKGTKSKVPLADILSGAYNPIATGTRWINGDPGVGKFMEFRVHAYTGTDLSMNPADYEPGKLDMIPLTINRANKTVNGVSLLTAIHHTFEFIRSGGGTDPDNPDLHGPWFVKVDGGQRNAAFIKRISAIQRGALEVFTIKGGGGWTHPVHIHFEEGIILSRAGKAPPEWEMWARKDMYRIGPENDSGTDIEVAYRARDFLGFYVTHCHNTLHEDHAMLMRWDSMVPGNLVLVPTPLPTWDGVSYEPSFKLDLADIGDGIGPQGFLP